MVSVGQRGWRAPAHHGLCSPECKRVSRVRSGLRLAFSSIVDKVTKISHRYTLPRMARPSPFTKVTNRTGDLVQHTIKHFDRDAFLHLVELDEYLHQLVAQSIHVDSLVQPFDETYGIARWLKFSGTVHQMLFAYSRLLEAEGPFRDDVNKSLYLLYSIAQEGILGPLLSTNHVEEQERSRVFVFELLRHSVTDKTSRIGPLVTALDNLTVRRTESEEPNSGSSVEQTAHSELVNSLKTDIASLSDVVMGLRDDVRGWPIRACSHKAT